jgi:hypothetical protein
MNTSERYSGLTVFEFQVMTKHAGVELRDVLLTRDESGKWVVQFTIFRPLSNETTKEFLLTTRKAVRTFRYFEDALQCAEESCAVAGATVRAFSVDILGRVGSLSFGVDEKKKIDDSGG